MSKRVIIIRWDDQGWPVVDILGKGWTVGKLWEAERALGSEVQHVQHPERHPNATEFEKQVRARQDAAKFKQRQHETAHPFVCDVGCGSSVRFKTQVGLNAHKRMSHARKKSVDRR